MSQPVIDKITPGAGVGGGEIVITGSGFHFSNFNQVKVRFGDIETRPISASATRIIAPIPSSKLLDSGIARITVEADGAQSEAVDFIIGQKLADNLHPVANPAYDRD